MVNLATDRPIVCTARPRTLAVCCQRGFTLVEMLVVMAIVIVLIALTTSSLNVLSSLRLSQSAELIQNMLTSGRRTALAHSHIVEVRFFQCKNPEDAASAVQWRAFQVVEMLDNGTEQPLFRPTVLAERYIMAKPANLNGQDIGTLLGTSTSYNGTVPANFGPVAGYARFRFMPDGSTDLMLRDPAQTRWSLTLYNENDETKVAASKALPPNYATLQVEPFTGAVSAFRP